MSNSEQPFTAPQVTVRTGERIAGKIVGALIMAADDPSKAMQAMSELGKIMGGLTAESDSALRAWLIIADVSE